MARPRPPCPGRPVPLPPDQLSRRVALSAIPRRCGRPARTPTSSASPAQGAPASGAWRRGRRGRPWQRRPLKSRPPSTGLRRTTTPTLPEVAPAVGAGGCARSLTP